VDIVIPQLDGGQEWSGGGGAAEEAEVARWLVDDGAQVAQGDEILELSLDKVNVAIEAPAAGMVRQSAQVGDIVGPGDVIGRIES
jgi:acetyl-CoA/propionyl-CoA carboxylase, biotin carboxylase, biotin carboxyl carrier protein